MKKKPDINQFKKDPSAFLEGGAVNDIADHKKDTLSPVIYNQPVKIHREQKIFRLSTDIINALKREAFERSMNSGSRVTETEIVEQALRNLLNL